MSEFLTIGEPLALMAATQTGRSLVDADQFQKFAAGAELNVAVGVARLKHSSAYLTALGRDPFGAFIIKELQKEGVATDLIQRTGNHWTGFQLKNRVSQGDPDTFYFRKDSAAAHFDQSQLKRLSFDSLKVFHYTGIFPAISEDAMTTTYALLDQLDQDPEIVTTFDPNLRPTLWANQVEMIQNVNRLAFRAKIVLPGLSEGRQLTGLKQPEEIADFFLSNSSTTQSVIVKLGAKGAFMKIRDSQAGVIIPGYHVNQIVDTVGAGDGFAAGLITGLLDHLSLPDAILRGNAIGALAIQSPGDHDGYPDVKALEQFQERQ
ncbi:sugar kinase [Secundilactobacillus folii]|uniref:Sugar kinase n=1 Tax=Secundilactobacillus folii TaxID=2678357 RepID=A0A7X2XXB0_9LACO|nr:sugar kinase [Secundilactobacillus folii]MTV83304.1 sugar kinase [Secundilactobacillus folii]